MTHPSVAPGVIEKARPSLSKQEIAVAFIGFTPDGEQHLDKIFQTTKGRLRSYHSVPHTAETEIDMLLIHADFKAARQEADAVIKQHPEAAVVIVAQNRPLSKSFYYIAKPLSPVEMIRVLDEIKLARTQWVDDDDSQVETFAYRVMIVDDSAAVGKALELELKQALKKINCDFADCGKKALEQVKVQHYDLIYLDIIMPGIDGFDVCRIMRETMEKTPIIMLTDKTSTLDEVKGVIAGCTTFLTKPVKHDEFREVLSGVVDWPDDLYAEQ